MFKDGKRVFKNSGFIKNFYVETEGGGTSDRFASREDYLYGGAFRIPVSYVLWAEFNHLDKWKDSRGKEQEAWKLKKVRLGEINNNKELFMNLNSKVSSAMSKTEEIMIEVLSKYDLFMKTGLTLYKEMVDNHSRIDGEHPEWTIDDGLARLFLDLYQNIFQDVLDPESKGKDILAFDTKEYGKKWKDILDSVINNEKYGYLPLSL